MFRIEVEDGHRPGVADAERSGNGISAIGAVCPRSKSTSVQAVAWRE